MNPQHQTVTFTKAPDMTMNGLPAFFDKGDAIQHLNVQQPSCEIASLPATVITEMSKFKGALAKAHAQAQGQNSAVVVTLENGGLSIQVLTASRS